MLSILLGVYPKVELPDHMAFLCLIFLGITILVLTAAILVYFPTNFSTCLPTLVVLHKQSVLIWKRFCCIVVLEMEFLGQRAQSVHTPATSTWKCLLAMSSPALANMALFKLAVLVGKENLTEHVVPFWLLWERLSAFFISYPRGLLWFNQFSVVGCLAWWSAHCVHEMTQQASECIWEAVWNVSSDNKTTAETSKTDNPESSSGYTAFRK